jgi:hypothetical protein
LNWLKGKNVGILTLEASNYDEFDLGTGGSSDGGGSTDIIIAANSHYITQGFSGTVTVTTSDEDLGYMTGWARDVKLLASYNGASTSAKILVIDAGQILVDGSIAADKRVFFGARYFGNLNANGIILFDRALEWAAS